MHNLPLISYLVMMVLLADRCTLDSMQYAKSFIYKSQKEYQAKYGTLRYRRFHALIPVNATVWKHLSNWQMSILLSLFCSIVALVWGVDPKPPDLDPHPHRCCCSHGVGVRVPAELWVARGQGKIWLLRQSLFIVRCNHALWHMRL